MYWDEYYRVLMERIGVPEEAREALTQRVASGFTRLINFPSWPQGRETRSELSGLHGSVTSCPSQTSWSARAA